MRILTVRQPWAWAIIHGGKDVENRVRNIAGEYRGPVAIHAGLAKADNTDARTVALRVLGRRRYSQIDWSLGKAAGVILGVVDLIGAHRAFGDNPGGRNLCGYSGQCSEWADPQGWHLELARPRALPAPIPYRGALGLRRLDDATTALVLAQIGGEA